MKTRVDGDCANERGNKFANWSGSNLLAELLRKTISRGGNDCLIAS